MKKCIRIILFLLLSVHTGCQSSSKTGQITEGPRYVSITPANTEILFALGLDKEIVAVTNYCNYPVRALSREKVGTFSNPSIEKIVSLKPDIVFATGLEQAETVRKLQLLKQNVVLIDPENFAQLFDAISLAGKLTGRTGAAESILKSMKKRLSVIKERTTFHNRLPRILVLVSTNPLMAAGSGSFIDEMIEIAGGQNAAKDLIRPYCRITDEFLIQKDPELIMVLHCGMKQFIMGEDRWKNVSAVKEGRVYDDINPDILCRPGPRMIIGLEEIAKRIERVYGK